jgi:hypothetical protein
MSVSESAAYRALARLNLADPAARRPRDRKWKRWERGAAMELWQMDVVGRFALADGTRAKALTGVEIIRGSSSVPAKWVAKQS